MNKLYWIEAKSAVRDHDKVIGYGVWHYAANGGRECVRVFRVTSKINPDVALGRANMLSAELNGDGRALVSVPEVGAPNEWSGEAPKLTFWGSVPYLLFPFVTAALYFFLGKLILFVAAIVFAWWGYMWLRQHHPIAADIVKIVFCFVFIVLCAVMSASSGRGGRRTTWY